MAGSRIADLPANKVQSADLEAYLNKRKDDDLNAQSRLHAETSMRHCWNWATKRPSPTPRLSPNYHPFSSVERTHAPRKVLTEPDLITRAEVKSAFYGAEIDLDQLRRLGMKATINHRRSGSPGPAHHA